MPGAGGGGLEAVIGRGSGGLAFCPQRKAINSAFFNLE